jgi:5,10-methylenetetrahydromethanopterin reductase
VLAREHRGTGDELRLDPPAERRDRALAARDGGHGVDEPAPTEHRWSPWYPARGHGGRDVKIGLLALTHEPVTAVGDRAALAERLGYQDVWVADDRFYRDVYLCLAHAAARTRTIRLATCVTDPYSRHPALTAMAVATLDELSGGRAVLGIGAGVAGFAALGIAREKPARAIREAVELVRRLLAGETVTCRGEVIRFEGGRLGFAAPRSDVPVYVASNGPLGQRVAGAVADGAIVEGCGTPEEACALQAEVRAGARRAGRDPDTVELVARLNTCIGADGAAARDVLRPRVARTLAAGLLRYATLAAQGIALPEAARASVAGLGYVPGVEPYLHLLPLVPDRFVDALALAGTVEEVAARVVALGRAGVGRIIVHPFAAPGRSVDDTIRAFAEEVAPRARAALARGGALPPPVPAP